MEIVNAPNRKKWLEELEKKHSPAEGTLAWYEKKEHLNFAEQEKHRFLKDIFERGKTLAQSKVHNAFGAEEDGHSDGYIDEIIFAKTGGTFTKIYGCPFKIKGISPGNVVHGLQMTKHIFSDLPRSIVRNSKIMALAMVLTWLFNRKGFLKIATELMWEINHKVIRHLTYSPTLKGPWPDKWYNDCEKEIERCLLLAAKGESQWEELIGWCTPFLKLFLYIDNTYKLRIQDALPLGNSLLEVLGVLLSRETKIGIGNKWKFIKYALQIMLLTSPALRRIEQRFFKNLNRDKIKMDLDDRYFSLTYKSYNFFGLPYEQRVAERKKLNEKFKVVFL